LKIYNTFGYDTIKTKNLSSFFFKNKRLLTDIVILS